MNKLLIAFCATLIFSAGFCVAGELLDPDPEPIQEESQWERFKLGAREAGGAVAEGTRRTAHKVAQGAEKAGEAVVRGSKKAGHAIAEGYEDTKEYVKEKID